MRPAFWTDRGVDVVYRQNTFLYTCRDDLPATAPTWDLVHPDLWRIELEYELRDRGLRDAWRDLWRAARRKAAKLTQLSGSRL